MTLEELGIEFVYKPSYLKKHWTRVKKYMESKGIELIKVGRGDTAQYGIKLWNEDEVRWETTGKIIDVKKICYEKELHVWKKEREALYANW